MFSIILQNACAAIVNYCPAAASQYAMHDGRVWIFGIDFLENTANRVHISQAGLAGISRMDPVFAKHFRDESDTAPRANQL